MLVAEVDEPAARLAVPVARDVACLEGQVHRRPDQVAGENEGLARAILVRELLNLDADLVAVVVDEHDVHAVLLVVRVLERVEDSVHRWSLGEDDLVGGALLWGLGGHTTLPVYNLDLWPEMVTVACEQATWTYGQELIIIIP